MTFLRARSRHVHQDCLVNLVESSVSSPPAWSCHLHQGHFIQRSGKAALIELPITLKQCLFVKHIKTTVPLWKMSHYRSNQDWRKSPGRGIMSGNWEGIWSPSFVLLTRLTLALSAPFQSPKMLHILCSSFFISVLVNPTRPSFIRHLFQEDFLKSFPLILQFVNRILHSLFSPQCTLTVREWQICNMMDMPYLPYHTP